MSEMTTVADGLGRESGCTVTSASISQRHRSLGKRPDNEMWIGASQPGKRLSIHTYFTVVAHAGHRVYTSNVDGMQASRKFDEPRVDTITPNPDLGRALERLEFLCTLSSRASVTARTKSDAVTLLRRMADEIVERPLPFLGLDADGCIVMTWHDGIIAGNLSVFGDGTYTYFLQRVDDQDTRIVSDDARISEPLKRGLVDLLVD